MSVCDSVCDAANRLQRIRGGEPVNEVYPDLAIGYGPLRDQETLAKAFLAEHAPDDNPINAKWLQSIGFETRADAGYWIEGDYADVTVVKCENDPRGRFTGKWCAIIEDDEHNHWPVPIESRSQLTRLLAALEIE